MAEKKISRKELLKSQDEFLTYSERTFNYVVEHSKTAAIMAAAFVAALLIAVGINWYLGYRAESALAAYLGVVRDIKPFEDIDPKNAEAKMAALQALTENYSGTKPARDALLDLGSLHYRLKQYDRAAAAYQKYLQDLRPEEESFKPLVLGSLAQVFEAQNKPDEAEAAWKKILDQSDDLLKEQAYMGLGRVYAAQGQKDKARQAYQQLLERYPRSTQAPLAEARLSALDQ
ncbi:MAG: tetratricopeptide repeat protein [Proteobacteria bacterium]|nr:tetratricopeptide repeat protein [Pseudomonadota bacterium]